MFVIVGMNIGFAVFSNVLIINSSATVSPNESDFKVIVYGFVDQDEVNSFMLEGSLYVPDIEKQSSVYATQFESDFISIAEYLLYDTEFAVPIKSNDYIYVGITIYYDSSSARVNGPFSVEFNPLKFEFTTIPRSYG